MAAVYPFRAWRYTARAGRIEDLATQPYDTIPPELEARYRRASPYNLAHLILPESHARSRELARAWMAAGILARDAEPSIYLYEQTFRLPETDEELTRRGFIALGDVEPYSRGAVHRHEQTLTAPREDRLGLLRATRMHHDSIFMLYPDADGEVERMLDPERAEPLAELADSQQTRHRLWRVREPAAIRGVADRMRDKKLLIADGHHRYEAALAFGAPRVLMTFVRLESPGLRTLAAHRVIHSLPGFDGRAALQALLERFAPRGGAGTVRFEAVLAGVEGRHAIEVPRAPEELNLTVLHARVLEEVLGITPADIAAERYVRYRRGREAAAEEVVSGRAQAAFLVEPLGIGEVARLGFSGRTLPQKSTDFYPKLLSGLVMNSIDD